MSNQGESRSTEKNELLKLRRRKYMHEIVSIKKSGRHFGGFKRRLDSFLLRINRIDTDLGPFRWSDRPRIKRFEMLCF